jgi:hypothetical protein
MATVQVTGFWAAFLVTAGILGSPSLYAQASRQAVIAQQQAEKARDSRPQDPSRVQQLARNIRQRVFDQSGGFFPYFGSVYSGGGFTLGAGYQRGFADRARWDVKGLYSVENYKLLETTTFSPDHWGGRLDLSSEVGWRDATQVGFYGIGMDTSVDDRANFRFQQLFAQGTAIFRPISWTVLTGTAGYEDFSRDPGQGDFPDVNSVYSPLTVPGLDAAPTYLHSIGTAGIDTRPSPGYTRTGGYYGVSFNDYADWDSIYSFDRLDAEVIQHVPLLRDTWVLSLRGRVQSILDDDSVVPIFLLPALGSSTTLRAYTSWRFRDRNSLLTQAEWRWIPNRLAFDMALFFDAGKVTSRLEDIDFHDLATDYGIGARFHTPTKTLIRTELAHGYEGWNLVFAGHTPF